jgi:hypothetical protein
MQILTLFACPKPFIGHDSIIQCNALDNWKALGLPVILLGDDSGVADAAKVYAFKHIPDIARTELGTPLLSDIFSKVQAAAETPLLCYTNADIIFPKSLLAAAALTQKKFTFFLMTGLRWDVDIFKRIDFSDNLDTELESIREKQGALNQKGALDYFIFPRGMVEMPRFAIGRPAWDNWMICNALHGKGDVIDATSAILILHQNHGYAHVPGRVAKDWERSPEALENLELAGALFPMKNYERETIKVAHWKLTGKLSFKYNYLRWVRKLHYLIKGDLLFKYLRKFLKFGLGEDRYSKVKSKYYSIIEKNLTR